MDETAARPRHRPGRWNRADRRAQVVEIAMELVAREGVQAATLKRIATEAGISAPALYNHFTSRAELLGALIEAIETQLLGDIDSLTSISAPERLRELGSRVREEGPLSVRTCFLALLAAARTEGLAERLKQQQLNVLQKFADIVEAGKKEGTIRQDADGELVAWEMVAHGLAHDFAALQDLDGFVANGIGHRMVDDVLARISLGPTAGEPGSAGAG